MLLSVDPAARSAGCALFDTETKELRYAQFIESKKKNYADAAVEIALATRAWIGGTLISKIRLEMPVVRSDKRKKGDSNHLLPQVVTDGAILTAVRCNDRDLVYAPTWKKQVKKEVMLRRIVGRLSPKELKVLEDLGLPDTKKHNVIDGIGLGLWVLKRL